MSKPEKSSISTAQTGERYDSVRTGRWVRSFAFQLSAINFVVVALVCGLSFVSARFLIDRLGLLTLDTDRVEALEAAVQTTIELKKVRMRAVEAGVPHCLELSSDPCVIDGIRVRFESVGQSTAPSAEAPRWVDDSTLAISHRGRPYLARADFSALKSSFEVLTGLLKTNEHLALILPGILRSFRYFLVASLVLIGCLGIGLASLVSARFLVRVRRLISYSKSLAGGQQTNPPASLCTFREIHQIADAVAQLAGDLQSAGKKLARAEKAAAWETVARKVAHEIKNPLTPIALVATELGRLAQDWPEEAEPRLRLLKSQRILNEETGCLERMVREFSGFARLPEPLTCRCDLVKTLKDFTERRDRADRAALRVESAVPAIFVQADASLLRQVLINLVNNSVRACAGRDVAVRFRARVEAATAVLDVADNGPGIPENIRTRVFDAYVTTKNGTGPNCGTGLGLTIARFIMEKQGGTLDLVETGPGGTVFRITLPLVQANELTAVKND